MHKLRFKHRLFAHRFREICWRVLFSFNNKKYLSNRSGCIANSSGWFGTGQSYFRPRPSHKATLPSQGRFGALILVVQMANGLGLIEDVQILLECANVRQQYPTTSICRLEQLLPISFDNNSVSSSGDVDWLYRNNQLFRVPRAPPRRSLPLCYIINKFLP